jgi:hypothetical protein
MAMILVFSLGNRLYGEEYQQVSGLIDLRSDFSDGAYDIESLVSMAINRGFEVLIINDHDRMVMEYGFSPFRNLIKRKVELPSINKNGAKAYLDSIKNIQKKHPDMIIIPGSETAVFYYWTGSAFKKNLTAHNHERRILTIGMEKPEDYENLPILHNGFSTEYMRMAVPQILLYLVILIIAIFLIKWKGFYRIAGIIIFIWCSASIANSNMFRSSSFDQYHGDQGIAPYQLFIDYVSSKGGLTFWNYPETKSGVRQMGPIYVDTPPYPEVLEQARGYTGFAAIYGDTITITEPGNIWDKILIAYCEGRRNQPVWGISTANFHKEGESGENLGNFPTFFLVQKKTKGEVLRALRNGRMYACRGKFPKIVKLDEFLVCSSDGKTKGISGDEIVLKENPIIKISLSAAKISETQVKLRLIRSGKLIKTFVGSLPMKIDYQDKYFDPGRKIYYRIDVRGYGSVVSNPVFVRFEG